MERLLHLRQARSQRTRGSKDHLWIALIRISLPTMRINTSDDLSCIPSAPSLFPFRAPRYRTARYYLRASLETSWTISTSIRSRRHFSWLTRPFKLFLLMLPCLLERIDSTSCGKLLMRSGGTSEMLGVSIKLA